MRPTIMSSSSPSHIPTLVDIRPNLKISLFNSSMSSVLSDDMGLCSRALVTISALAWVLSWSLFLSLVAALFSGSGSFSTSDVESCCCGVSSGWIGVAACCGCKTIEFCCVVLLLSGFSG